MRRKNWATFETIQFITACSRYHDAVWPKTGRAPNWQDEKVFSKIVWKNPFHRDNVSMKKKMAALTRSAVRRIYKKKEKRSTSPEI